jgi:hypothetical protein
MVNAVKVNKQSLSSTIAANFQSFSIAAVSSSSRILSVIILSSFSIRLNSLKAPIDCIFEYQMVNGVFEYIFWLFLRSGQLK